MFKLKKKQGFTPLETLNIKDNHQKSKFLTGFTLIELLVVIAIVGILSSVVLVSLNTARAKSRDAKRMNDLREMQKAVDLFYHDNGGVYPSTGSVWHGGAPGCYGGHGYDATGFIPGVVPDFISELPADPKPSGSNCYLYRSNGTDYMILVHRTIETFDPDVGPHPLDRPAHNQQSIAVYSPGARMW